MAVFRGRLRINRPFNQNVIMGCILFCLPGIYLALTGLGAGGGRPSSQRVGSLTNSILYGIYTFFGWWAGAILNYLEPKWTILVGATGYPIYVASLWYYDRVGKEGFPLFGGAFLGFCAALFWTSAGFISYAYPEEKDKGLYISLQWVLNSCGSTVGALIALAANKDEIEAVGVSNGVYIAFIVIMVSAIVLNLLCIVHPKDVVRDDGRHLAIFKQPSVRSEIKGVLSVLIDPKIICMLPAMFIAESNIAMTSSVLSFYFNLRTRSLLNLLFQVIMIPTPLLMAWVLDNRRVESRRTRGIMGASVLALLTLAFNAGYLGWVASENIDRNGEAPANDWTDAAFGPACVLYLLAGIVYACYQIVVQWVLGALSNDPATCARYAGAFKGTVSLGMCIAFTIDSQGVSYKVQAIIDLVLYAFGLACLMYVLFAHVRDTNYFLESTVIVPEAAEEIAVSKGAVTDVDVEEERVKEEIAEQRDTLVTVEMSKGV